MRKAFEILFSWRPNREFCAGMLYYLLPVLEMYVELVTNFGYFCFFFRVYDLYLGILCLFDVKLEETKKKVKKLWRVFVLLSLLAFHICIYNNSQLN